MNRRGFLGAILTAAAAPAIVRAGSLMPIWLPQQGLIVATISDLLITRGVVSYGASDVPLSGGDWEVHSWVKGGGVFSNVVLVRKEGRVSRFLDGESVRYFPSRLDHGLGEVRRIVEPVIGRIPR
jgi:hypothetical protein